MKVAIVSGRYERAEAEACRSLVRSGDKIVELGAAVGYVGLFCLTQGAASRVVSVEANPGSVRRLVHNYDLSGRQAEVISAAIAAKDGEMVFYTSPEFWGDGVERRGERQTAISVPTMSFRTLWSRLDFEPDVVIADIEGAEVDLPWRELPTATNRIIIELHPRLRGPAKSFALLKLLMDLGFEVAFCRDDVFGLVRSKIPPAG